ncbi:MAG: hypothetical protein JNK47_02895 [Mesorhizobium sp.]|nr:hypothetical protein [Mesorhizobium sp.]MBL8576148.1 hypothetical protein [Mesorhizobium sp.]
MNPVANNADLIEVERRAFFATSNPMHVWAAFRLARVVNADIPPWVMSYLDLASKRLLALASDIVQDGTADNTFVKDLAAAFFFKGAHPTNYHSEWITYGMNVRHLMQQGDKETFAIDAVAEHFGVSASTVRGAYKQYDRLYPGEDILPQDVVSKISPE